MSMHVHSEGSILFPASARWRRAVLVAAVGFGLGLAGNVLAGDEAVAAATEATAGSTPAAEASSDTTPAAAEGKQRKDGKICRSEEVTGSRMPKRVCLSAERWEARERAARELMRELDGKSIPADAAGG
jgi:hypothetical protein